MQKIIIFDDTDISQGREPLSGVNLILQTNDHNNEWPITLFYREGEEHVIYEVNLREEEFSRLSEELLKFMLKRIPKQIA